MKLGVLFKRAYEKTCIMSNIIKCVKSTTPTTRPLHKKIKQDRRQKGSKPADINKPTKKEQDDQKYKKLMKRLLNLRL